MPVQSPLRWEPIKCDFVTLINAIVVVLVICVRGISLYVVRNYLMGVNGDVCDGDVPF